MKTNKYLTVGTILNSNRERYLKHAKTVKTDGLLVIAFGLSTSYIIRCFVRH